jgi:hypothetical protein
MTVELSEQQIRLIMEMCEKTPVQGRAGRLAISSLEELLAVVLQAETKEA